jgi:plasmid stabilization system protein ParE
MKVVVSAKAEADLEEIGDWIARDNPIRAASFVRELREACLSLAEMPRAFPLLAHRVGSGIRRKPYRNYLIFYSVCDRRVDILHVLHGARDYDQILVPK